MEKEKNTGLKKLDPNKRLVASMVRRYGVGKGKVSEVPKKPTIKNSLEKFPEQKKEKFDFYHFISKNLMTIAIILIIILIITISVVLLMPQQFSADFIDETTGAYIPGYVYFDGLFVGETDGESFKGFTDSYCSGGHIARIESGTEAFEWQTYPADCKAKKLFFKVNFKEAKPSENILFKFIDNKEDHVSGKLYFDGLFVEDINGLFSLKRAECQNITKIKLESASYYGKWDNYPESCLENSEISFKISTI